MSLDISLTIPRDEPTRADLAMRLLRDNNLGEFADFIEYSGKYKHGPEEVYSSNITSNLIKMADAAGIYEILWRPQQVGITKAHQLIEPLAAGLQKLRNGKEEFQKYNPANGWGSYDGFVTWCSEYLVACINNPEADITAC